MITVDDVFVLRLREHKTRGVDLLAQLIGACTPKPEGKPKGLEPAGSTASEPSNVPVADTIAEAEKWGHELAGMMEALGHAVASKFEHLTPMRPEEQESVSGLVPLSTDHAEALRCLAVRLYRLQNFLDRMQPKTIEPAPVLRSRGRQPGAVPIKVMAEGWEKEVNARPKGILIRKVCKDIATRDGYDLATVEREARRVRNATKAG